MLFLYCFLLTFFSGNVYAEEPDYTIEVGAHRNFEIFVAPVEVINTSEKITHEKKHRSRNTKKT